MSETMEAGRELDALIAEKWFGYQWWRSSSTGRRCIYAPGRNPEHMTVRADMTERLVEDWRRFSWTPAYSTDIAAAWLILDALDAADWDVKLEHNSGGVWYAYLVRSGRFANASADTAPLTICLAALAAVHTPEDAPK